MRFAKSDAGNIGLELIAFGIIGPLLIAFWALQLMAVERQKLAAQQLARQVVRAVARDSATAADVALMAGLVAQDLGLDQVRVGVRQSVNGGLARATATVAGNAETAVMRVEK